MSKHQAMLIPEILTDDICYRLCHQNGNDNRLIKSGVFGIDQDEKENEETDREHHCDLPDIRLNVLEVSRVL